MYLQCFNLKQKIMIFKFQKLNGIHFLLFLHPLIVKIYLVQLGTSTGATKPKLLLILCIIFNLKPFF